MSQIGVEESDSPLEATQRRRNNLASEREIWSAEWESENELVSGTLVQPELAVLNSRKQLV